jgi:hypothetical protein
VIHGAAIHLANEQASQFSPNALCDTVLPVGGLFLAHVFVPVPVNECRHSEIHLSLDIQVAVFISKRFLLSFEFFRQPVWSPDERVIVWPGNFNLRKIGSACGLRRGNSNVVQTPYEKPPFGGPEHVLHYLARYTHRVAISNHRLLGLADGQVTFRWKDNAHGSKKRKMTVSVQEFLRRLLLHVLPKGFVRIRFFGFLANRRRAQLAQCQRLLAAQPESRPRPAQPQPMVSTWLCPLCGGTMIVVERLTAQQVAARTAELQSFDDTS